MATLNTDIRYIKGVGEARAKSLAKLGITDLRSLLSYFPRTYDDRRAYKKIADLIPGETVEEADRLAELFLAMIRGEQLSEEDLEDLDEAAQLQDISPMPDRVKCAELAWRTLDGMLEGQNNQ